MLIPTVRLFSNVISGVPNQYPKLLFSYSNHPSSFKTFIGCDSNDPIVHGAKS